MELLLFIFRRILRYVYRTLKLSRRDGYLLPKSIILLALVFLTSVYLTTHLVLYQKIQDWQIADVVRFAKSQHQDLGKSYLPLPFQSDVDLAKTKLVAEFDPRLVPALWLNTITNRLKTYKMGFETDFSLPFRWDSFLDLLPRVVSPTVAPSKISSCSSFRSAFHIAQETCNFCKENDDQERISWFQGIQITDPIDVPLDECVRIFIGANYLIHLESVPERAVLLGVGPGVTEKQALVVPLYSGPPKYQRVDVISLVESYLARCIDCESISLTQELEHLRNSWTDLDTQTIFRTGFDLQLDSLGILNSSLDHYVSLDSSEFCISGDSLYCDFDNRVYKRDLAAGDHNRVLSANLGERELNNSKGKYFHEAQLVGSSRGSHFDWRFFKKSHYSTYEHQVILHRLSRAWLRFSDVGGLKSWLAHGTLLGWYWNGLNMPWDQDLDVQMTVQSLFLLARNYNQTIVVDFSDDPEFGGVHLYFVDVSSYIFEREHGDGKNVIDARFIDMDSGMYVDITGVAITKDYLTTYNVTLSKSNGQLHKVFDSDYANVIKSVLDVPKFMEDYLHKLNMIESNTWESGHLYNCKNFHFYNMLDLEPLKRTSFEGEQAYVPANFESVLKREYPKGTLAKEYGDWIFRPFLGLWVHKKTCKNDYWGADCQDKNVLLEEKATRSVRLARKKWFEPVSLNAIRADPWIMERNQALEKQNPF